LNRFFFLYELFAPRDETKAAVYLSKQGDHIFELFGKEKYDESRQLIYTWQHRGYPSSPFGDKKSERVAAISSAADNAHFTNELDGIRAVLGALEDFGSSTSALYDRVSRKLENARREDRARESKLAAPAGNAIEEEKPAEEKEEPIEGCSPEILAALKTIELSPGTANREMHRVYDIWRQGDFRANVTTTLERLSAIFENNNEAFEGEMAETYRSFKVAAHRVLAEDFIRGKDIESANHHVYAYLQLRPPEDNLARNLFDHYAIGLLEDIGDPERAAGHAQQLLEESITSIENLTGEEEHDQNVYVMSGAKTALGHLRNPKQTEKLYDAIRMHIGACMVGGFARTLL
jgi:hypothetical protein